MSLDSERKYFASDELKQKIFEWGAALAGFGDVRIGLARELSRLSFAITLAVPHPVSACSEKGKPKFYWHDHPEVDLLLQTVQSKIVAALRQEGWFGLAIPPDSARISERFIARIYPLFPHKTAATCAGLGWIGKSGLLITPEYGPCLSWATVLTNAPLEVCHEPITLSRCGDCRRCIEACPAKAIRDVNWVRNEHNTCFINAESCRAQIELNFKNYGIKACGLCVEVCRYNHKARLETTTFLTHEPESMGMEVG